MSRRDTSILHDVSTYVMGLLRNSTAGAWKTALEIGSGGGLGSDTDGTLAANSDALVATQKAVKTYVDNAVTGLFDFKGSTNTSGNPNYPAASKGDAYVVTVAGKIGGASGKSVDIGDVYVASADNAGGTEASVGFNWFVLEHNLVGALLSANNLSDLANVGTAQINLGLGTVATLASDTDTALAADSDARVATQKATRAYVDTAVAGVGGGSIATTLTVTGDITPSQITSNQNNYNPTGLSMAAVIRLDSDAARNITGLDGGTDGRILILINKGSFPITLKSESSSSTAGLRFGFPSDVVLGAKICTALIYDSTASRWMLWGSDGGASLTAANTWVGVQTFGTDTMVVGRAQATDFVFGTDFRIKSNPFLPGIFDVRNYSDSGLTDMRVNAVQVYSTLQMVDTNIILGTSTGTKFGTSVSQKMSFWNATPIVQPSGSAQAALTNSTGGTGDGTISAVSGTGDDANLNNNLTELYTLLNAVRTALVNAGLMKGSA